MFLASCERIPKTGLIIIVLSSLSSVIITLFSFITANAGKYDFSAGSSSGSWINMLSTKRIFSKFFPYRVNENHGQLLARIPYARHYNPRFVYFLPHFYIEVRFILQTTYVLKMDILHFLSLKSAVYNWERFQIESGL